MTNLVKELYEAVPEFEELNDPFFNEYDHTVYGNFGLFIEDVVQIHKYGKILKQQYFGDFNLEEKVFNIDLDLMIFKSFEYIKRKFENGSDHDRSVINTSFFKIIVTSNDLSEYATKYFSKELMNKVTDFWRPK